MENHRYVKSAKKRQKIAYDVPRGKIKSALQRNTLIQKETLRIHTQTKGSKKIEIARMN